MLEPLLRVLKSVPPGLGGACATADGIAREAGLALPETREALRALFDGGFVLTDSGGFDDDSWRAFFGSPTGDREAGYAITVEALPDGRFLVEEPPDPNDDGDQDWEEFDTEAEAMKHAEKVRRLHHPTTLIVRRGSAA